MKYEAKKNEAFMRRALALALRGQSSVSPNPMVGAVFVKNGKILAESWHQKFGEPHAEALLIQQLKKRGISAAGGDLYVNLEPCVEFFGKKTPSCVQQIIQSGIRRVFIAMNDPNPRVSGRGIQALKKAKISVEVGCLRKDAMQFNQKFITWMRTGLPFVTMKVAMSLDGKIATKTGDSKWITSPESRRFVKQLRDEHDAILVGIHTVLRDNPELKGMRREPLRIILDSKWQTPKSARVLRDSNVLLVTTRHKKRSIPCKVFPKKIHLAPLLRFLGKRGISSVLVEGGSEVFGSFVDKKLVDRFVWFIAPKIIGGRSAKTAVGGEGVSLMKKALVLSRPQVHMVGSDFFVDARFEPVDVEE